jgi:hypothetical protein
VAAITLEFSGGARIGSEQIATIQFSVKDQSGKLLASTWDRRLPYRFAVGEQKFWSALTRSMRIKERRRIWLSQQVVGSFSDAPIRSSPERLVIELVLVGVTPKPR